MTTQSWQSLDYAVIDVEGNGAQPPDLVELAVVPITAAVIGTPRSWVVRPPRSITWQARRVHGISDADVIGRPAFADIACEVSAALDGRIPVGHNVRVDLRVLGRSLPDWHPIEAFDTLRLSRSKWPQLPSHRLGVLVEHRGLGDELPAELVPHRARYDALVTARLFVHLAGQPDFAGLPDLRRAGGIDLAPADAQPELRLFE